MKLTTLLFSLLFFFLLLPSQIWAATLSLSPSSQNINKGCALSLNVELNTQNAQTDGTDAIILYDTTRFSATSVTSGTIYSDYPGNNIDEQTGKITISGLASINQPFVGTGTLATINFVVKDTAPAGVSQVRIDFDPNDKTKTTDSNVVETSTVADVLNAVTDGSYTIGTGSCIATVTPTPGRGQVTPPVGTSSATLTPTTLPPSGTMEFTYTIAILGSILTILGILGLALL